jgi:hypothetical protein
MYGREKAMSDHDEPQPCYFCKSGRIIKREQKIAFHQWTNRGYVFCHATIPIGTCNRCGSKSWDDDAEAIIEAAIRSEYDKLV